MQKFVKNYIIKTNIMLLDKTKNYTRRDSIIYDENGNKVVTLKQKFIDCEFNSSFSSSYDYMNKYIEQFPHLVTIHIENVTKVDTKPLTLF